jgi:thiamine-monophosphate kinase
LVESERELIERIARATHVRPGVALGIGDDAAVLDGDPLTVVAHDMLVDEVHFRRTTSSPTDIGHKALAVNLSDLAAMGASPTAALIGLGLPGADPLPGADVDALYAGMEALAARYGVTIAGGDLTRAPALVIGVTAIGHMPAGIPPCLRSTARAGDLVCITGSLGGAAAGLLLLEQPALGAGVPEADALRTASRRPTPRVAAGQTLAGGGATAMMDCSDGLALDATRLAAASGVAMELDLDALPLAPGVVAVARAAGVDADLLAATGGDDYELIVTVSAARIPDLVLLLDVPLTTIGRVVAGSGVTLRRSAVIVDAPTLGWEHRFD